MKNSISVVIAVIIAAVTGSSLLLTNGAHAMAGKGIITTYYNNAQHSQIVGQKTFDCIDGTGQFGVVTPYLKQQTVSCF